MHTVMQNVLVSVPRAAAIWTILVLFATLSLAGLQLAGRRGRRPATVPVPVEDIDATQVVALADRPDRAAAAAATAVAEAEEAAARRRAEWLVAQAEAEQAWAAYEAAETAARRLEATVTLPAPRTQRTPAEYADREHFLHRAAMRACAHNALSPVDLTDALAHRHGWDPRLHPVEQEIALCRAVRDGQRAAERAAAHRERQAWRAAEDAAEAARIRRAEALAAVIRATPVVVPAAARTPVVAGGPVAARAHAWRHARAAG
ncbi:MAG TPA: hypothetical protein VI011_04505 [Asanoa sp.]